MTIIRPWKVVDTEDPFSGITDPHELVHALADKLVEDRLRCEGLFIDYVESGNDDDPNGRYLMGQIRVYEELELWLGYYLERTEEET